MKLRSNLACVIRGTAFKPIAHGALNLIHTPKAFTDTAKINHFRAKSNREGSSFSK